MSNITIKDIAKALNFSVSTISKALNNSYEISPVTKKIVTEYAKANNYTPNRFARSLKAGQSTSVGVIISSFFSTTFLAQIIDGIYKASYEVGYDIIIMQSFENVEKERACLDTLISKGVDGILIAPVSETSNTDYLNYISENLCPIVLFDRINPSINTTKVGVNEYNGVLEATKHLIEINRKRILFVTGDKFGENNQRILGFKKALKNLDIPLNSRYMIYCNLEQIEELDEKIRKSIIELREMKIGPNAIFGATDLITIRTLGILAQMGIKVPEEIAVIGFANTDIAFSMNPPLSAIRQPARDMGYMALKKLIELIELEAEGKKKVKFETILLETVLNVRKSTQLPVL